MPAVTSRQWDDGLRVAVVEPHAGARRVQLRALVSGRPVVAILDGRTGRPAWVVTAIGSIAVAQLADVIEAARSLPSLPPPHELAAVAVELQALEQQIIYPAPVGANSTPPRGERETGSS